ncbi:aldose 1-epimerase Mro [Janthinobacterium sp. HH01]|uniref:aldose epimerase family protein n=1 Tax=Janthinobacterium sp. HH01 TaxID=1198452 RepID=UPI0002AECE40|nr:aldose epimerase family protein [Janthinobacterium sp. HH01]ELX09364.1 aldose 1-epimerase Mro [Janthinobacterium sp. HH01]
MQPTITNAPFGPDTTLYTLTNANGMIVKISTLGGVITEIHTPDRNGQLADVCLGFDDPAAYLGESHYFGALIGRYGNRIANGRFTLDGETYQLDVNNGINHLHGGQDGFHRRLWEAESFATPKSAGLILSYLSPDGEQGYPGNLEVTVIYELRNDNELRIAFHAISDKATPVNLTNHAYFNLAGKGDILAHELTIVADAYTPVDSGLIPTGELPTVAGTPFDFRTPHAIGARIDADDEQLRHGAGYDHNFVLNKSQTGALELATRVRDPSSGRVLEVLTQEPGIQFYSGNFLHDGMQGKGRIYGHRSGFCLEPQHYPDSPNRAEFPSTILRPGEEYTTVMAYRFSVGD